MERRVVHVVLAALVAVVVALASEAPFMVTIALLVVKFGLWGGFLRFTAICGVVGILVALAYDQISNWFDRWISRRFGKAASKPEEGLRREWIARAASIAKPLGALITAVFMGPALGIPGFKALGYEGWRLYVWTLISAPIFSAVWVFIYGSAANMVVGR